MMKITFNKAVIIFCLTLFSAFHTFATNVSGIISTNTNWSSANNPYIVTGNILIGYGAKLTIQQGVIVKFDSATSMQIDGTLQALGTSGNPILFTSNASNNAGAWGYIYFSDLSTDAVFQNNIYGNYISGSILSYCTIQYAGNLNIADNGAVKLYNAHPYITHCNINNNKASGIRATNLSSSLKIDNCTITNNKSADNGGGIYISNTASSGSYSLIDNNTISNNHATADGGGIFSSVQTGNTLELSNNIISGNTSVNGAGICNNQAGNAIVSHNVIVFNTGTGQNGGGIFNNNNSMAAISDNIISNNSISSSHAEGGGISIVNQSSTKLNNNIIADNTASYTGGGVYSYQSPTVMTNNHIVNNTSFEEAGTYFNSSTNDTINYNTIAQNKCTNLNNHNNSTMYATLDFPVISYNNIFENSTYENIYNDNDNGSGTVFANNNWWGSSADSTVQRKIYDGVDNVNLDLVSYLPFLTTPDTLAPIAPPANVIKTNIGGGHVLLTWNRNTETDTVGYHIYFGGFNGYKFNNVITVTGDTTYTLSGVAITDTIAVTAFDRTYNPANDNSSTVINENMTNGNESWYGFAHSVCNTFTASVAGIDATCFNCSDGSATVTVSGGQSPYTFIWNTSPNQYNISATNLYPATYQVVVSDNNGCSITDSIAIHFRSGVSEINISSLITIYPNPATDKINIQVSSFLSKSNSTVTIYNITGQVVKREALKHNQQQINVADLNNGIYTIEVSTKEGVGKQKSIIQR